MAYAFFFSACDIVANPSGLAIFLCPPFGQPFGVGPFLASGSEASSLAAVRGTRLLSARLTQDLHETSSLAAVRVRGHTNTFLYVDLCARKINI